MSPNIASTILNYRRQNKLFGNSEAFYLLFLYDTVHSTTKRVAEEDWMAQTLKRGQLGSVSEETHAIALR
ncbi:hypothetical protein TNCV_254391 [Trichonephila clavipes]|nr:hypothetical protein TNCV_254391 [Trichonephila clavipes]